MCKKIQNSQKNSLIQTVHLQHRVLIRIQFSRESKRKKKTASFETWSTFTLKQIRFEKRNENPDWKIETCKTKKGIIIKSIIKKQSNQSKNTNVSTLTSQTRSMCLNCYIYTLQFHKMKELKQNIKNYFFQHWSQNEFRTCDLH